MRNISSYQREQLKEAIRTLGDVLDSIEMTNGRSIFHSQLIRNLKDVYTTINTIDHILSNDGSVE